MKLLLYCSKAKPYLYPHFNNLYFTKNKDFGNVKLNGKIVAECDFEVEEIEYSLIVADNKPYHYYEPQNTFVDKFYEKSCLNHQQVEEYLGYKNGYAIHIKNLHIFDKPRDLDFYSSNYFYFKGVEKAPQNMMKVWEDRENPFVLISIKPEWLCKILNGEKTIEVRKKVLKEMIK